MVLRFPANLFKRGKPCQLDQLRAICGVQPWESALNYESVNAGRGSAAAALHDAVLGVLCGCHRDQRPARRAAGALCTLCAHPHGRRHPLLHRCKPCGARSLPPSCSTRLVVMSWAALTGEFSRVCCTTAHPLHKRQCVCNRVVRPMTLLASAGLGSCIGSNCGLFQHWCALGCDESTLGCVWEVILKLRKL